MDDGGYILFAFHFDVMVTIMRHNKEAKRKVYLYNNCGYLCFTLWAKPIAKPLKPFANYLCDLIRARGRVTYAKSRFLTFADRIIHFFRF